MGVDTAHALFNALFYYHNSTRSKSKIVKPVWSHKIYAERNINEIVITGKDYNIQPENWDLIPLYENNNDCDMFGDHGYCLQSFGKLKSQKGLFLTRTHTNIVLISLMFLFR